MSSRKQESAQHQPPSPADRTSSPGSSGGGGSAPPRGSRRHPSSANGKRKWPVENISRWPISALLPYARNPKTHPPAQIDLIAQSLARWGQAQVVLIDGDDGPTKGEIIAGHGRVLAAEQLGWIDVVVGEARGWSDEEKRAYRIADNELGSERLAPYDDARLRTEIAELKLSEFDIPLLGFDGPYLMQLLDGHSESNPDAIPHTPTVPTSKTGDLWIMGNHRLLCGDSTNSADVSRLMHGERAALFATDPPYAVGYSGGAHPATKANRAKANRNKNWIDYHEAGLGDAEKNADVRAQKFYEQFVAVAIECAIAPTAPWYCWHASRRQAMVERIWNAVGALVHQQIIWVKTRPVLTYSYYMWQHEPCLFGWIKGKRPKVHRKRGGTLSTVWQVPNSEIESSEHPTSKPTRLFDIPIEQHTSPGDICFEPFSGSGTQIISAQKLSRRCFALELSPVFVDVAIERWQKFTGKTATLEDGRTFAQVKEERNAKGSARGGRRLRKITGGGVPSDPRTDGSGRAAVGAKSAKRKGQHEAARVAD